MLGRLPETSDRTPGCSGVCFLGKHQHPASLWDMELGEGSRQPVPSGSRFFPLGLPPPERELAPC